MILIIGGAFQGKLEYAIKLTGLEKNEFADGASCGSEEIFTAKGIRHFQEYIRRCMKNGKDCSSLAEEIIKRNPHLVVISTELGCGIVPVEPFDRAWREATGRVCTSLAAYAGRVDRVICGLGMVLKDDRSSDSSR